jgi:cysteine-rich repeat protein
MRRCRRRCRLGQIILIHSSDIILSSNSMALTQLLLCILLLTTGTLASTCGNGLVEDSEECDDANLIDGDGCDTACLIEPQYRCDSTPPPSVCKIDAVITLTKIGISRLTSANTAVIFFKLNYEFALFRQLNFAPVFTTSIPSSNIQIQYSYGSSILEVTVDYRQDIENTVQSFQLHLASTGLFWYDSAASSYELNGVNCELTYQDNLWISTAFSYAFLGIVVASVGVGFGSMFCEKWVGLELVQTYQSVYYLQLLMK